MVSERYQVEVVGDSYYKRVISCQNACPAHIDVQGCVNTIASGDYEDGYIMVRQPNLLASTCGRVFNYPCHGSIFDRYGVVHAGPAPRPLDSFPISIEAGEVIVDTGTIIQRSGFDEFQVTKV